MSRARHKLRGVFAASLMLLCACQSATPAAPLTAVEFRVLHASATCGTEEPSVRRIAEPLRLKEILADSSASAPDPARSVVLRLSMGQQPSGGARFKVLAARANSQNGQLDIEMEWAPPDRRQYNTMALTRPCVIVDVGPGEYRHVRMLDLDGRERAAASLPAMR